jgi:hypothetical protein
MNWHCFFTKDTLRRARQRAMLTVGGGRLNPHPGWGCARVPETRMDEPRRVIAVWA